jgi:zinc transport system substrate-binding protein
MAGTITLIKKTNVTALFAEPQYPAKAAQAIARETGAKLYTLDPLVTGPMKDDAYLAIMAKNLTQLQKALK